MSFSSLKQKSAQFAENVKKATEAAAGGSGKGEADARFYYPETDANGNGSAVLRFLPPADGETIPFQKLFKHGFKSPSNKWFIAECPTTVGKDCPVCKANGELWATGLESNQKLARDRKRKVEYYLNVYVVRDPKNPENEGTVRIFKCGQKIFDKIKQAQNPDPSLGEEAVNPFDMWEGANFKLKIRKVDNQTNYDTSSFDAPTALLGGDDKKLEQVYNQIHKLQPFVAESLFKSYDELEKKYNTIVKGNAVSSRANAEDYAAADDDAAPAPQAKAAAPKAADAELPEDTATDDADLEFFKNLANS